MFGKRGDIDQSDIPELLPEDRTMGLTRQLEAAWNTHRGEATGNGMVRAR